MKSVAVIAGVGALILAGCSGNTVDGNPAAQTGTSQAAPVAPQAPVAAPVRPATPREKVEAAPRVNAASYREMSWGSGPLVVGPGSGGAVAFRSPTGNVGCIINESTDTAGRVVCHLGVRDTPPAPKPPDCGPGPGWSTDHLVLRPDGAADGVCTGGVLVPTGAHVLPYGSALVANGYGCLSEESGVTCVHTGTGRGFTVSRQSFTTF